MPQTPCDFIDALIKLLTVYPAWTGVFMGLTTLAFLTYGVIVPIMKARRR